MKTNKKKLEADLDMFEKHPYFRLTMGESSLVHDAIHAHTLEERGKKVLAYLEGIEETYYNVETIRNHVKQLLGGE